MRLWISIPKHSLIFNNFRIQFELHNTKLNQFDANYSNLSVVIINVVCVCLKCLQGEIMLYNIWIEIKFNHSSFLCQV